MTDFLNRLAERTLGLTPRVMPLLASRYSPSLLVEPIEDTLTEEPPRIESHSDRAPAPTSHPNDHGISSRTDVKAVSLELDGTMPMDQPSIVLDKTIVPTSQESSLLRREPTTHVKSELPKRVDNVSQATAQWSDANSTESMLQRRGSQHSLHSETKESLERSNPGQFSLDGREPTIVRSLPALSVTDSIELTNHSEQNSEQSRDEPRSRALDAQLPPVREGRGIVVRPVMERAAQQFQAQRAEPKPLADSGQPFPPPNVGSSTPSVVYRKTRVSPP